MSRALDKGREGRIVGIISSDPPWKDMALGVLGVVSGVLMVILGLMILGAMMVYSPPAELILQLGMFSLFLLIAGFILVLNGRRRLNRKKEGSPLKPL